MLLSTPSLSPGAQPVANKEERLRALMQKPLIVGASISGDRRAHSPGKKLATRYTAFGKIKTVARNGSGSFKILEGVTEKEIAASSVVIGLDLFFWDSTMQSVDLSLKALDHLIEIARKHSVPLVLGEVPDLLAGFQPSRAALNKAIAERCQSNEHCYMMPLDPVLQQARRDGSYEFQGKIYPLADLLPDGLHLSSAGSEVLAEKLKELLESHI